MESKNEISMLNENELQNFIVHVFGNVSDFKIGVDSIITVSNNQTSTSGNNAYFSEKITSWDDPVFQTKTTCVQRVTYPGGWTCTGWKTQRRYYRNEVWLTVSTPTPTDIKKAVEQSLSDAAVIAAIVGIATGGSAAIAAFKSVFTARLTHKIKDAIVDVSKRGNWGSWI